MMTTINNLPFEILEKIFNYLPFNDIRRAAQVCYVWYGVAHGQQIQQRQLLVLWRDFRQDLTEDEIHIINKYKHLSIVQEYDNAREVEGNDVENSCAVTDDVCWKEETNIANILFQQTDLYSLQIFSRFKSIKNIFQNRLHKLAGLKELMISFSYHQEICNNENNNDDIWQLRSNSLEIFRIGLPNSVTPFNLIAPQLKELHLTINCNTLLEIVKQYCNQLEILKVKMENIDTMDNIMSYKFPRLKHLDLAIYDDKELYYSYRLTETSNEDELRAKTFISSASCLKTLTVQSNVAFYRICPQYCFIQTNLKKLELHNLEIDAKTLLEILLAQQLTDLTVHHCEITNHIREQKVGTINLHRLRLVNVVNNIFLDLNYCGLELLDMSHDFRTENRLIQTIFLNLTSLKHLSIRIITKPHKDAFQLLHQMKHLRSLTLEVVDTTAEHWSLCVPVTTMEQLTIRNCFMLQFSVFTELARVFPALKRLHIDWCHIFDDTSAADAVVDGRCEQKLRQMFANSIVSWHETAQITPNVMRQLLM